MLPSALATAAKVPPPNATPTQDALAIVRAVQVAPVGELVAAVPVQTAT
jgi:hypothetical protein